MKVSLIFIGYIDLAPIPKWMRTGKREIEFLLSSSPACGFLNMVKRIRISLSMKDLPHGGQVVAMLAKRFEHRFVTHGRLDRAKVWPQEIHAGCRRELPQKHADARRVTDGRLAMRIGECNAATGQGVNVRRLYLGMAVKTSHPIIQVIN